MDLALQFVGAIAILAPHVLFQTGHLSQHAPAHLLLDLVGSGVLTGIAYIDGQWGFVIVQAVRGLVAAWGLLRRAHGASPRSRDQAVTGRRRSGG